jgi:hypothetical protein
MNNVIITQLDPIKVPLVKRFYKEHYPTGKANKSELIYSIELNGELCGVVRFRTIEDRRLLTRHQFIQIAPEELPNNLRVLYERYSNSGKDLIPMHYQQNC